MGPLVVLVGETASGKSALALELAERCNGEIICADSRTVYRGMDIGTAKPSPAEQARVPHHLLNVVEPDEAFSAARFKELALVAMADVAARGRVPFLVGGSGLYVDAVLYNYTFRPVAHPELREQLQRLEVSELQARIRARGLPMPENAQNKRHLVRVLETGGSAPKRGDVRAATLQLGLQIDREVLRQRVAARVDAMLAAGLIEEVQELVARYGADAPGLLAPGYKAYIRFLSGQSTAEQARDEFIRADLALAKRQRTWFKRNSGIQWLNDRSNAVEIVTTFLNKSA